MSEALALMVNLCLTCRNLQHILNLCTCTAHLTFNLIPPYSVSFVLVGLKLVSFRQLPCLNFFRGITFTYAPMSNLNFTSQFCLPKSSMANGASVTFTRVMHGIYCLLAPAHYSKIIFSAETLSTFCHKQRTDLVCVSFHTLCILLSCQLASAYGVALLPVSSVFCVALYSENVHCL